MKYFAAVSSDSDMKLGKGRPVGFIDYRTATLGLFDCLVGHYYSEAAAEAMRKAAVKCLHHNLRVLKRYDKTQSDSHRIRACLVIEQAMSYALRACRRTRKAMAVDMFMDPRLTLLVLSEHHAIIAYNTASGVYRVRDGKFSLLTAPTELSSLPDNHPARQAKSPSDARWILDTEKNKQEQDARRAGKRLHKRMPFDMLITDVQVGDSFIVASDGLIEFLGFGGKFKSFSLEDECGKVMDGLVADAYKSGISGVIAGILMRTTGYERDITRQLIEKAKRLQQLPAFQNISPPEILRTIQFMKIQDFVTDQTVFLDGQRNDRFYIVLTGQLEMRKNTKRIAKLGPGDCFGEMALVGRGQRYTDVTGKAPGKLLTMSSDRFRQFCAAEPHISSRFLTSILRPLHERINRTADKLSMALASIDMIAEGAQQHRAAKARPGEAEHSNHDRHSDKSIIELLPDIEAPKPGRFADRVS